MKKIEVICKMKTNWIGGIIFFICLMFTFIITGLILYGFWLLWLALAAYGLLGIVVYLIFIVVFIPVILILFIIAIIPVIIGISAIDR